MKKPIKVTVVRLLKSKVNQIDGNYDNPIDIFEVAVRQITQERVVFSHEDANFEDDATEDYLIYIANRPLNKLERMDAYEKFYIKCAQYTKRHKDKPQVLTLPAVTEIV